MTTTADVLRAARGLIDEPEKWIKGQGHIGDCYCVAGAIIRACRDDIGMRKVIDRLFKKHVTSRRHIYTWNDARCRKHYHVLEAFDKLIALAEAQEAAGGLGEGA